LGDEDFVINTGDRIAQIVVAPVTQGVMVEVEALDDTERGTGGFGSTGV
jgi:dUTP pyrophosphatase